MAPRFRSLNHPPHSPSVRSFLPLFFFRTDCFVSEEDEFVFGSWNDGALSSGGSSSSSGATGWTGGRSRHQREERREDYTKGLYGSERVSQVMSSVESLSCGEEEIDGQGEE